MVSFIHNESEMTTWMGHSFKTKRTKCIFKIALFFLNFKLQIIRLAQRHWLVHQLSKTTIFIAIPMKQHI